MPINKEYVPIDNQPTIKPRTVTGIFTRYIAKTLPLAFDESMSYYECLCALLEYINTKVIPALDNNAAGLLELQEFYNELQTYVNDYFKNLDVQEEINNKLDEMAESGQLTDIIAQYLGLAGMITFDNVADMKLAENLVNGSKCKTLGFRTYNDGGGAFYKIRQVTNDDVIDEMTIIEVFDNLLVAELLVEKEMNVKQFGAYGDGTHDDTTAIQTALDTCPNIAIQNGTYMIDAVTHLIPNTGNRIKLNKETILKVIPNSATSYSVFLINDVENVEINGGTIEGDKSTHTGESGEWGHCIRISGTSNNIFIHEINLINAWGDGIAFAQSGKVTTENVHVKNVRRNGYSVGNGYLVSNNDYIELTSGTNPQDGVDIEPDTDDQYVNAVFNNLTTKQNSKVGIAVYHMRNNSTPMYIEINNYKSIGDTNGLWIETGADAKGKIIVNNPVIQNNTGTTGAIRLLPTGKNYIIDIINPIITGYPVAATAHAAIYLAGHSNSTSGNIRIINPIIKDPVVSEGANNTSAISVSGVTNGGYEDTQIINPLDLGGKLITCGDNGTEIIDQFNTIKVDHNGTYNIPANCTYFTSSNYTANRIVNIPATGMAKNKILEFINTGDYNISVKFTSQYIYPLSAESGKTVVISGKGSTLKVKKITSDGWTVLSSSGTVTVS